MTEVLGHLSDDQIRSTLADIFRMLRPDGVIVATTPHAEDFALNMIHCPDCGCTFHRWQHMQSVTVESMSGWMQKAGFIPMLYQPVLFKPEMGRLGRLMDAVQTAYLRLRGLTPPLPHLIYIGRKPVSGSA